MGKPKEKSKCCLTCGERFIAPSSYTWNCQACNEKRKARRKAKGRPFGTGVAHYL